METIATSAAAPVSPSVFTVREANTIKKAIGLIESKRLKHGRILHYFEDFERYLILRFAGLTNEQGHVLYLGTDSRLLAAETEFFGDHKSVAFDLRRIVLRALTLGADSIVFAHNHPNDNPTPSNNDLHHLKWSEDALRPLNIALLDSYVVTSKRITSIKKHRERINEMQSRQRIAEYEQRSAERRAKMAATRAAKRAAQHQGDVA